MIYKRATQRTLFGMALVGVYVLTQHGCAHAQVPMPRPRPEIIIIEPQPPVYHPAPMVPLQPVQPPIPQPFQLDIYGPHPRYEQ
jgi:hypothetical protein